jgi:hypothetical protein
MQERGNSGELFYKIKTSSFIEGTQASEMLEFFG